jgi:hypothetical protein
MVRRGVEAGGRPRKSRDALTSRPEIERLLDAARAPAGPRELAGEHAAIDLFARARLVDITAAGREDMKATRSARTGLKAAVAAAGAVGLLSTGVAFAASGHAPWSQLSAASGSSTHAADPTRPTHPTHRTGGPTDDESQSTGPNAHAFGGLCRAYSSGNKTEHGKALESPPFVRLVTAAGGADNVAAFCGSLATSGRSGTHPNHPGHPTKGASPTHPVHPAHPSHPTQAASPTHSSHPSHPSHPTQAASPTRPAHPSHPTQAATPTHPAR